ncbi:MAG: hypothetical protein EPO39_17715 [Candidatus Manganitrophaceae bacterium]|nr:MAG: hypothetical protein EPO39_17715 [Candidatus Manganitrophaceae bacterium]
MMKKSFGLVSLFVLLMGLTGIGSAGQITGEIVKIDGEMVSVKDSSGKVQQIHVDPKGTKKSGDLKVGAKVKADVQDNGHANSVEVEKK